MEKIIAKIGTTKYKTTFTVGNHTIIGDEPVPHGNDEGPTPYDYLLTALGGCVTMTLRMYADRKKWDLQEVEVELSQQRVHHKDCGECESTEGYAHLIEKKVKLTGNLDETQRARLMEIADKCPRINTIAV